MSIKRLGMIALLILLLANLSGPVLAQAPVAGKSIQTTPRRAVIVTPIQKISDMAQEPLPPAPVMVKIEGIVSATYDERPGLIVVDEQPILVTDATQTRPTYTEIEIGDHVVVQASWDGMVKTATYIRVYQDGGVTNAIEFRGLITELPLDPMVGAWTVAGYTVIVTDVKAPTGPAPALGYYAHVVGSLQADQSVRAIALEVLRPDQLAGRFEFEGTLDQIGNVPGQWVVGGVRGWVEADARIEGERIQGAAAQVVGHQTTNGGLIFDQIVVASQTQKPLLITGLIEAIEVQNGYGYWRVGGQTLQVDDMTFIDESRCRAAVGMWAEAVALPMGVSPYALRIRVERPE